MVHQRGADLPEELVVVVDLLGVSDGDPCAFGEGAEGGALGGVLVVGVDVQRPVGEVDAPVALGVVAPCALSGLHVRRGHPASGERGAGGEAEQQGPP
jgi:hypothetical protein